VKYFFKKNSSIKGQTNINEIYSLPTEHLEKIDLSNSGMSSSIFPTWILDASNIKDLDISNTQITGLPQREVKSSIKSCNFSNTPICGSYQSSPYANFIPDSCKGSCSGGYTPLNSSNGKKPNGEGGGSSIWIFLLIGVAVIAILGALGFLYMKKAKKRDDELSNYDSPRPILPVSKRDNGEEKDNESFEIAVDDNTPSKISEVAPANAAVAAVAVPQAAAVVNHDPNDKKIEEVARNNYASAYGGDAKQNIFNNNRASGSSVKDIYRQHNVSTVSEQEQSYYPHPSIYNTMTTDIDSDDEVSDINQPIIADLKNEKVEQEQPALLRRKSSRKANNIKETPSEEAEDEDEEKESKENEDELYVANWDYAPTLNDELALTAGDVIEIKKKFDDGWSTGYNRRTKQTGIVPLCYLKEYED